MDQKHVVKRKDLLAEELSHKTAEINQVWQQIKLHPENSALWQVMTHLSQNAAELSHQLVCAHDAEIPPQLKQSDCKLASDEALITPSSRNNDASASLIPAHAQTVFFMGNNSREVAAFDRQLASYGYALRIFTEPQQLLHATEQDLPACFIVNLHVPFENDFSEIQQLKSKAQNIPLIVLAPENSTSLRLQAVRAGANAFVVPPLNMPGFIDMLDRLTGRGEHIPFRILIIDDSQLAADFYARALQDAGMHTAIITQPMEVMHFMAEFDPDLVLIDLTMPQRNGSELAEVIRQHEAYVGMPIIFLSADTTADAQLNAIKMKGDEFLAKPININHLIAAVRHRAQRFRQIKALIVRDSLTGLYNHSHIKELLQRELSLAHRNNQPLQFVMIDLDHFKWVNDRYGHLAGDSVIKLLARLLKQRLRTTDILGRYGGEEFALILPNTTAEQAEKIINMIRQHFSELAIATEQGECKVTFSAGMASYPDFNNSNTIVQAADEALYQSKNAGRNCVTLAKAATN